MLAGIWDLAVVAVSCVFPFPHPFMNSQYLAPPVSQALRWAVGYSANQAVGCSVCEKLDSHHQSCIKTPLSPTESGSRGQCPWEAEHVRMVGKFLRRCWWAETEG